MKERTERNIPAYLRLYETLRQEITSGVYPPGSRLPSKRVTAEAHGVSVITVEHAYALLSEEGYLETRERSGCFVAFEEGAFPGVSPEEEALPPMSAAPTPSLGALPYPLYARALRRMMNEVGAGILERSPTPGIPYLREALCAYLARSRGIHATPEQIFIGAGAEYLYGILAELLAPEHTFAIEDPSYAKIARVYRAAGITPDPLPLGQNGITSAALLATKADVLHVTPYRSYPTGVTASAAKKREYLAWADARGNLLIEDDVESEFSPAARPYETLFTLSQKENVVYLNSFSATLSPALRLAYLVLPRPLLPLVEERVGFRACPVPTPEQYAVGYLIASGEFERHINRTRHRLREHR